jgi:hypothetical protein
MSEPEHRPEFAIAIAQPLWIEAKKARAEVGRCNEQLGEAAGPNA